MARRSFTEPVNTCWGYWPDTGTPCLRMLRDGQCPKFGEPEHGYWIDDEPSDPRWDWANIQTMGEQEPTWIKGTCKHLTPETVETRDALTGDVFLVAKWCPDCEQQIWNWADDLPEPNGFERWAYAPSTATEEEKATFTAAFLAGDERLMVLPDGMEITPLKRCPCGYLKECGIHCGPGHDNGRCPPWNRHPGPPAPQVNHKLTDSLGPPRVNVTRVLDSDISLFVELWEWAKDMIRYAYDRTAEAIGMPPALLLLAVIAFVVGMTAL